MKIAVISLGCHKNLVDTEFLLGKFLNEGHEIVNNKEEAHLLLINTCAFIAPARQEAYETIEEGISWKKRKRGRKLLLTGCLPALLKKRLTQRFPEIDEVIKLKKNETARLLTTSYYAYLKIAKGCDNHCSYCKIPSIKGKYQSRSMVAIIREAQALLSQGVKELNIVAQDTTYYQNQNLAKLLKKLCALKGDFWIRILYAHPAHITDELIDLMAAEEKICPYLDLPLQHINNRILKSMRRKTTTSKVKNLIKQIRKKIPQITLRTTFIVGYPGESRKEFQELSAFIKETAFDKVGFFPYFAEEGTKACQLKGPLSQKEKEQRVKKLASLQKKISLKIHRNLIGQELEILSLSPYYGRSFRDAPEVDGLILIKNAKMTPGKFLKVKITKALPYDLEGELIKDDLS